MLGLKELAMKQAAEEQFTKLRERYKEWLSPNFAFNVDWDGFKGFGAVAPSYAVDGGGSVAKMAADLLDILRGAVDSYKKLGDAGLQMIQSKVTGFHFKADPGIKRFAAAMNGTTLEFSIPNVEGGDWARGGDDISAWKKVILAAIESGPAAGPGGPALGVKELSLKQAAEENFAKQRERYKAWLAPAFNINVNWDSFAGFGKVAPSHAIDGAGSIGTMTNEVLDIISDAVRSYEKLGDAGLQIIRSRVTGINIKADANAKKLGVAMNGTVAEVTIPNAEGGSWSRGQDDISSWKKTIMASIEA